MSLRVGWFSTGRDEDAIKLLERLHDDMLAGKADASIEYVFCNRERGEQAVSDRFLDVAAARGLRVLCLSSVRFMPEMRGLDRPKWRELFDSEVVKLIEPFAMDVLLLAGYMLILSPVLHERFTALNLHPARPGGPVGSWEDVIWQIIAERHEDAGAMVNVVTAELDRGPAVAYCTFPIRGGSWEPLWEAMDAKLRCATVEEVRAQEGYAEPLFAAIRAAEFKREAPLLLAALQVMSDGRVAVRDGKVLVDGRPSAGGVCVNEWVERLLTGERERAG